MYAAIAQASHAFVSPLRPLAARHLAAGVLLACTASAGATPLVSYDFDGPDGSFVNGPASVAAHLTASAWSDDDGTLSDYAGVSGRAVAASSWNDGNAFRFALTVAPGYSLQLSSFGFEQRASSTGAKSWALTLDGATLASGTTSTSFAARSGGLALSALTDQLLFAVTGTGANSSTGTWRIDNFLFSGTLTANAVPEPPAPLLLAPALGVWLLNGARRARERAAGRS